VTLLVFYKAANVGFQVRGENFENICVEELFLIFIWIVAFLKFSLLSHNATSQRITDVRFLVKSLDISIDPLLWPWG
jgi:hypothetical protein